MALFFSMQSANANDPATVISAQSTEDWSNVILGAVPTGVIVSGKDAILEVDLEVDSEIWFQVDHTAQETLTNAIRPGDAESIPVRAATRNRRAEMTIKDNGNGMSGDLISFGMGLLTMRRTANLIRTNFDIQTSPGDGTSIRCSVQLPS